MEVLTRVLNKEVGFYHLQLKPSFSMKQRLLTLFAAILMSSCSSVHITHTEIASGASNPRSIYIRPFTVKYATFKGNHGTNAERAIRKSLAPDEFAGILQEQLCKIAPAMVIADNETAPSGWLVEGDFECVDAGLPGASRLVAHVRIYGVGEHGTKAAGKDSERSDYSRKGRILYDFIVTGDSWGPVGSIYSPGLGYATPFDYRNAAERIMMELSTDPHRFGYRTSTTIRD